MSSQIPKPRNFDWAAGSAMPGVLMALLGGGVLAAPSLLNQSWSEFYGPSVVEGAFTAAVGAMLLGLGIAFVLGIWLRGSPLRLTAEGVHQVPAIGRPLFIAWSDVDVVTIYPSSLWSFGVSSRWYLGIGGVWTRNGRAVPRDKISGTWLISQLDVPKSELIAAIMPFLADRPGRVVPPPTDAGRAQVWVHDYRWEARRPSSR